MPFPKMLRVAAQGRPYLDWRWTGPAPCGRSPPGASRLRKKCLAVQRRAVRDRLSMHARTRRTAREHVQLHFPGEASAIGSSVTSAAGDGGHGVEGDVAAVCGDVFALRAAIDSTGEAAAGVIAAGALQRA